MKRSFTEKMMKKIFAILTVFLLITACGGGGYGNSPDPQPNPYSGAPTGNFSGQVDPVQTTNN